MASLQANPFSDRTYREKRALLGVAIAAIALVEARLVPDKVSPLGVEHLTPDARAVLVRLLLGVVFYFVFVFVLRAVVDCIQWRVALQHEEAQFERTAHQNVGMWLGKLDGFPDIHPSEVAKARFEYELAALRLTGRLQALGDAKKSRWVKAGTPAALVQLFFDFGFPPLWGGYALWCLWHWTPS
jgi:hypothetical protein